MLYLHWIDGDLTFDRIIASPGFTCSIYVMERERVLNVLYAQCTSLVRIHASLKWPSQLPWEATVGYTPLFELSTVVVHIIDYFIPFIWTSECQQQSRMSVQCTQHNRLNQILEDTFIWEYISQNIHASVYIRLCHFQTISKPFVYGYCLKANMK